MVVVTYISILSIIERIDHQFWLGGFIHKIEIFDRERQKITRSTYFMRRVSLAAKY